MSRLARSLLIALAVAIAPAPALAGPGRASGASVASSARLRPLRAPRRLGIFPARADVREAYTPLRVLGSNPLRGQVRALERVDTTGSRDTIVANRFNTTRILHADPRRPAADGYDRDLGRDVVAHLDQLSDRLGSRGHWIDMGAGELGAIEQYVSERTATGRPTLRVTGLAAVQPHGDALARVQSRLGADAAHARGLFGRLVDGYSPIEIGRADVITDDYGPAAYVPHLDELVEHYGRVLNEGGEAWMQVGSSTRIDGVGSRDRRWNDAVAHWLRGSGLDVLGNVSHAGRIHVRRTGEPLRVRTLALVGFMPSPHGLNPARTYRTVDLH